MFLCLDITHIKKSLKKFARQKVIVIQLCIPTMICEMEYLFTLLSAISISSSVCSGPSPTFIGGCLADLHVLYVELRLRNVTAMYIE